VAKRRSHIVNWQARAAEFSIGDEVFPFMFGDEYGTGRVVQVYPAIGMVDVEYPSGVKRYPVEELQRITTEVHPPTDENVPGGPSTVSVPGGPPADKQAQVNRLAHAYIKKSLYWASKDRKYRASSLEREAGAYTCPKCKDASLQDAIYKRAEGVSERLLGCPTCLFLIKACDIVGHPSNEEVL
jgi:hypothetical protein